MPKGTLVFDIETLDADLLYTTPPEEFVRLVGYRWVGQQPVLTTDLVEVRESILKAETIIGHNINTFDLPAVFGVYSDIPLELTMQHRVYDTWTHAVLVNPAPYQYTDRFGKNALADKPERMKKWFSLDEQAHQLGVPGKTHDLKELAFEFGDPSLPKKERIKDGFGKIPIDDERYREYLLGDIAASEAVARELLKRGPLNDYALREQEIEARKAVIQSNGFRVDQEAAQDRVNALSVRREDIMQVLEEKYDFPTEGKAPWATSEGKEAILKALADNGVTPKTRKNWTRTATGNLSLGGQTLVEITKGTDAEEMGVALAELKGQRSLAQLALDSMRSDGFVHPQITMLQRSGRWSTTEPGLTIWTARGPGAVEKVYFLPDDEDEVLIGIDYSNADARIVAAESGDKKYAERFEPGADGHMINALAAWGKEVVDTDPASYRQKAKPLGHGWSYGGQAKTLAKHSGVPYGDAKTFCDGMNATYYQLVNWQNRVRKAAQAGYVINDWGRKMPVEKGREFTQAPALKGQSGTREIMCDALLRMPIHVLRRVKAQIHDELIFSVPRDTWEKWRDYLVDLMSTSYKPKNGGQLIDFPVGAGDAGENWYEAAH